MAFGKWYYSKEELKNSPSQKDGVEAARELRYRREAAELIHTMGDKLNLTNAIISSAVTYMHRFYVYHSFVRFHRYPVAATSIFLAAKSESMPKKLESVIRIFHSCIFQKKISEVKTESKSFQFEADNVLYIEHIMIQTLGFELNIEHSHVYVLKFCQEINASKDFAQACYFLATEILETTTMCLQYSPEVTASFCIYFVNKLTNWEIFESYQRRNWIYPEDNSDVSLELLEKLEEEFKVTFNHSRTRWRQKVVRIVEGRNSPQLTSASESEASNSTDSCSPPQQAGSESVLGQVMPQQLANPSLRFSEVPSDRGHQLAQPLQKCLTHPSKSEDPLPKPRVTNNSVSIFNPDVPDEEVQKILSKLMARNNQCTIDKNSHSTGAFSKDLPEFLGDPKPSTGGGKANHHSRPSLVVKIPRDRINEALDSKLEELNRPPIKLKIGISSQKSSQQSYCVKFLSTLNGGSASQPKKKIKY